MPIRVWTGEAGTAMPVLDYYPAGNSFTYKSGDLLGLLSGTSAQTDGSPAGTLRRFGATQGGAAASFPPARANGMLGMVFNDLTANASGIGGTPAAPTGVNPAVPAVLAVPSFDRVQSLSPAIAGVQRSMVTVVLANDTNFFVQRHKKGTRVNQSLVGATAALTYNATTLEFEVDTTGVTPGTNDYVVITDMCPFYNDNRTWYDSSTFATDAYGAWVVFQFLPAVMAAKLGLRYSS